MIIVVIRVMSYW